MVHRACKSAYANFNSDSEEVCVVATMLEFVFKPRTPLDIDLRFSSGIMRESAELSRRRPVTSLGYLSKSVSMAFLAAARVLTYVLLMAHERKAASKRTQLDVCLDAALLQYSPPDSLKYTAYTRRQ